MSTRARARTHTRTRTNTHVQIQSLATVTHPFPPHPSPQPPLHANLGQTRARSRIATGKLVSIGTTTTVKLLASAIITATTWWPFTVVTAAAAHVLIHHPRPSPRSSLRQSRPHGLPLCPRCSLVPFRHSSRRRCQPAPSWALRQLKVIVWSIIYACVQNECVRENLASHLQPSLGVR